jgi:filamentous hemagglutinin
MFRIAAEAMAMTSAEVAAKSLPGQSLDIKESTSGSRPYDGVLFQGTYITLREAGDMLAGFNGRSHGFTLDEISRITGSLQAGGLFGGIAAAATYASGGRLIFGPPPYYGETPYAGRSIVYGYNLNLAPVPVPYHEPAITVNGFRGSPFLGLLGPRP